MGPSVSVVVVVVELSATLLYRLVDPFVPSSFFLSFFFVFFCPNSTLKIEIEKCISFLDTVQTLEGNGMEQRHAARVPKLLQ